MRARAFYAYKFGAAALLCCGRLYRVYIAGRLRRPAPAMFVRVRYAKRGACAVLQRAVLFRLLVLRRAEMADGRYGNAGRLLTTRKRQGSGVVEAPRGRRAAAEMR